MSSQAIQTERWWRYSL